MREGARIYAPRGALLQANERLEQPGLVAALELLADEGAASVYRGTLAEALLALMEERGGLVTPADLARYEPLAAAHSVVDFRGAELVSRTSPFSPLPVLGGLPELRDASPGERAVALARSLRAPDAAGHTTNITTVDREGTVCVLTTSLGLGSGDWVPGYDLHLNSMLGETDLLVGPLTPGSRMQSMMAPTLAVGSDGPVLAAGAAGGTRLRSALVQVIAGILDEGLDPAQAVARPRLHPAGDVVNVEPGFEPDALAALEKVGLEVRAWTSLHHYFGGVSAIAGGGAAGDPRRDGGARLPR
ncbi:MAG: gamma-glutamyltransferase [Actinobacteria bacterium]|nr:gamma-glutamyltransferase [Actinomycetota bacterium]